MPVIQEASEFLWYTNKRLLILQRGVRREVMLASKNKTKRFQQFITVIYACGNNDSFNWQTV